MKNSIITTVARIALLIAALFLFNAVSAEAQTFSRATTAKKKGFDVSTAASTGETLTIFDVDYEVGKSKNGSMFISLPKKDGTGNYPFWIGTITKHSFEGQTVRITKSGKYFIFKKSKRGLPYYDYIKAES